MDVRTVNNLPPAAAHDEAVRCLLAIELSKKSWIVAVNTPLSEKISRYRLKGCDWKGLLELIEKIRARVGRELNRPVEIISCYEAGYDGFWLHRLLEAAKLKEVKGQLRRQMHRPIPEQSNWLKQVVIGFFAYHAVPTNFRALLEFRARIKGLWLRTLRRRSQKDQTTWERSTKLADDFIPQPRILHPWPNQRFAVTHPRWAPDGESRTYGVVRGAPSNGRPYRDRRRPHLVSDVGRTGGCLQADNQEGQILGPSQGRP